MNKLFLAATAAATFAFGLAMNPASAANARHPYENIDHRVDRGNDTGDSQVERLNQAQLNQTGTVGTAMPSPRMPSGAPDQTTVGGEE